MKTKKKFLVDTCVWMDLFDAREPAIDDAEELSHMFSSRVQLFSAPQSFRDVYYLMSMNFKADLRESGVKIDSRVAQTVNSIAWRIVEEMRSYTDVAPSTQAELDRALKLKKTHADFEDNLVVAAAETIQADAIVTTDKQLLAHSPVPALTPHEACKQLAR